LGSVPSGVQENDLGAVNTGKSFAGRRELSLSEKRRREAIATRPDREIQCVRAREDHAGRRRPDSIHEKRQTPRLKVLNSEVRTVVSIDDDKIIFDKGEIVRNGAERQPGENCRPGHCQCAGSRV
jgi:hypothetical protein